MNDEMLALALDGFYDAQERNSALRLTSSPSQLYASTVECVFWASTLDEQLREKWSGYEALKAQHLVGRLMPGVRYVRNLKTHSLPMTMATIPGTIYPVVYPRAGAEVVWLALENLPAPKRTTRYTPEQQASYAEHLAGQPVRHTIGHLAAGFSYLASIEGAPFGIDSTEMGQPQ